MASSERAAVSGGAAPSGEPRLWLQDGDEVTLRGRAEREGFVSIGFGLRRAEITPAPSDKI